MFGLLALALLSAEPTASSPLFIAKSASGTTSIGILNTFEDTFAVTLQQPTATIKPGHLVDLVRADIRSPKWPETAHIELANGDRIPLIAPLGGDANSSKFNVTLSKGGTTQSLSIPLTAIASVWFHESTNEELLNRSWLDSTKKLDALRLRNGDVVRGTFDRFSDTGAVLFVTTGEKQAKSYEVANLQALTIEPSLIRIRKPKSAYSKIVLRNGARLSVNGLSLQAGNWNGTLLTGASVRFPMEEMYRIDVELGPSVSLTELKPKNVKIEPYGRLNWPMQLNRNAKGGYLMLKTIHGEELFDTGLGLHSKTTLTYELAGKYTRFEALLGLDANTGQKGHVEVSFYLDGVKQHWNESNELSYLGGVKPVFLDVSKTKEFTLVVDYGQRGDIQDDVNLVHPKLIVAK